MGLKSKKKLFKALEELRPTYFSGVVKEGLEYQYISNQTYGKRSFIYIRCRDKEQKQVIRKILKNNRFSISSDDGPQTVAVRVSYFKGYTYKGFCFWCCLSR